MVRGLVGIHVNKLKDADGDTATKGGNPFDFKVDGENLSELVKCYTPSGTTSKDVYKSISDNIEAWIEDAIDRR